MDRERLEFRSFFNAGPDKVTGICDGEGSDIFERDDSGGLHCIGSLYGYLPEEISEMSDAELEEAIAISGIKYERCQQWYVPEASDEYFAQVEEDKRNDIDDLV